LPNIHPVPPRVARTLAALWLPAAFAALACGSGADCGDDDHDAGADGPIDGADARDFAEAGDDASTDGDDAGREDGGFECPPAPTAGFHAAVGGSPGGDGSRERPWDLATALAHPAAVAPGDTIWIHGGVYPGAFTGRLAGEPGAPIVVRPWPGAWVTIDGAPSDETTLSLEGRWTEYHGLEVTNSRANRNEDRPAGVDVYGPNLKLVNALIHDGGNCGYWTPAVDFELYGCLIYNNGYDADDRAHGHGVYAQNLDGTKRIEDNVLFDGYSFGIHAYTEGGAIQGFEIVGNIWFQSGVAAAGTGTLKDNCLVGGLQPAARIALRENLGWALGPTQRSVQLGYSYSPNEDVTLVDNYLSGRTDFSRPWNGVVMTGNTFLGTVSGVDTADFPDNAYVTEQPTENRVFVRPNRYEPRRAHVAVYNWTFADTQEVDLSGVLAPGDPFEIRNAQNWFAGPVVSGTFDGTPLSLPLVGLEPAQPVGSPGAIAESEMTGRAFNVFVVRHDPAACPTP
jgi:hypothetical protein